MQNKKGFTLIELMIVVAIIAILAMIAVPMFQRYIERSRNSAAQSLLHQLATAMVTFNTDRNTYPVTASNTPASPADTEVEDLMPNGFRPDPNVAFQIGVPVGSPGFILYAAHKAPGSQLYVYDNTQGTGVMPMLNLTTTDTTPPITPTIPAGGSTLTWFTYTASTATPPVFTATAGGTVTITTNTVQ